jgi:hypothetical protein
MLTALEQGVKGGRWYTLLDKVYAESTLRAAFARVKANRGVADARPTIAGGPWPSLRRRGCFPWHMPMPLPVSPDAGDSSTGEPDAGDSPVRFGGRGK